MNSVIKELIHCAKNLKIKENLETVIHCLQILSVTDDLSVFDPGSFQADEFYSLLYELLSQPPECEVVWCALSVVQVAVRNPGACAALSHTYHCIPPLTALLDSHIYPAKLSTVLSVIQELSFGVVIRWQEAHLPTLMQTLVDIIKGDDSELIPLALGVMVNLCHNNKPAIYTLINTVNIKVLIRTVLNLPRENAETSMQVCKLIMVIDELSGSVPDGDILSFVKASFKRIGDAFTLGNANLMRHVVDFFRDAKESEHGKNVILKYTRYAEDAEKLIAALSSKEPPNSWQCVRHLVEFLEQLICLVPAVMSLSTQLTRVVLPWLRVAGVAQSALTLLSTVLRQARAANQDLYETVSTTIINNMEMIAEMVHTSCRDESCTTEEQQTLTSLLHLLNELACDKSLSSSVAGAVDKDDLKNLLLPLVLQNGHNESQLFQQPVVALYVEVLSLVSNLSKEDKEWLMLFTDLLQKKQILKALAVGLYFGSYEVKKKILFLAGAMSFSKECLANLSKCLEDLSDLTNSSLCLENNPLPFPQPDLMEVSLYRPNVDGEGLNRVIEKLDDLLHKNQFESASLASVIELYHFKLSEMRHAEDTLRRSLAAADSSRAQLMRRVAHMGVETSRLHQLLYSGQLALENAKTELSEVREQRTAAHDAANKTYNKLKQLKQDFTSKSLILKDQTVRLEELTKNLKTIQEKKDDQDKLIQNLESRCSGLSSSNSVLEEKVKTQDKEIAEQKRLIANQRNELLELERMRKIIYEISGGKKNLN